MNTPYRRPHGGRIDRSRRIRFQFDGRGYDGHPGDTLASALLACGVRLVGRSFKYHRPRGLLAAGVEEPNGLVTVRRDGHATPNLPATTVPLTDGLIAESQNRWPSLRLDAMALNDAVSRLLPAGFYYKTFMGPTRGAWRAYEHVIRKAAGMGRADRTPDPLAYDTRQAFCDVLVIGSGPAGLGAALVAGCSGARVLLVEQNHDAGGALLDEPVDSTVSHWLQRQLKTLASLDNVTVLTRTTAFGVYDGNTVGLIEQPETAADGVAQRSWTVRATAIVFATGALERPLVFANNDRPGVMLASALRSYLHRHAVVAGHRGVLFTNNDSAYTVAADLARQGLPTQLCDMRSAGAIPAAAIDLATRAGVDVHPATAILDCSGRHGVHTVTVAPYDAASATVQTQRAWRIHCDVVGVSGGWSPTVHLTSHTGVKPVYREDIAGLVPGGYGEGQFGAGAIDGEYTTTGAFDAGRAAGHKALLACGLQSGTDTPERPPAGDLNGYTQQPLWQLDPPAGAKAFVDIQTDVTTADLALAHREGYESVEHLKRYTTLGMGTDQGKTANVPALALMAAHRKLPIAAVGTTTYRPPFTPVAIGALAGRAVGAHFRPTRRTPMHDWHLAHGAVMTDVGLWRRPWYYRGAGADVDTAYVQEMRHVRESAGLIDISTLGKIDVQGPDAAVFLDRVYVNGWRKLPVGRARYGVMLRDDGFVLDDGTTSRLGEDHFFMTTTTAGAARVQAHLEFLLDAVWPALQVRVCSLTDEWAAMSLAGPLSARILAAALPAAELSDTHLPPMGLVDTTIDAVPVRIIRISFSGERAYEIYTPAGFGLALWTRLWEAGQPFGLKPYGVEALGALRIEKGHAGGPELDGRTTLGDLGLARLASSTKAFVGQALARRPGLTDTARRTLVGLTPLDEGARLRSGSVLFATDEAQKGHGRGHVTSTTYSPTLGHCIALALLEHGAGWEGRELLAVCPTENEIVRVRVVPPVFIDPQGARLHA